MESELDVLSASEATGRKAVMNNKVKSNLDGTFERYKAGPVVIQRYVFFCCPVSSRWPHSRNSLSTRWMLQGDLDDEKLYKEQPEGFRNYAAQKKFCRFKKALRDLNQTSRV